MNPEAIAKLWLAAFNEHNLENLLSLYAEDAVHYSPKLKIHQPQTNGLISGKLALRNWWEDAFIRLPELHYHIERLTANSHSVFMEYTRIVPNEPELSVAEILIINDGKIVASRVYHG